MGTGFSRKKKQAKALQEQMLQMQSQLKNTEVTGTAANGLVSITLTGEHDMKKISIKPECVDPEDVEGLEDLIKVAYTDALNKVIKQSPGLPGGFPGM